MKYDESWEKLYFPDFSPYASLDPVKGIDLVSADPFSPGDEVPDFVKEAYKKAIDEGKIHYSPSNGEDAFQETIRNKLKTFNHLDIDTTKELLVTPGSAYGLYLSIRACIRPNKDDEVINFDPTFAEDINDVNVMGAVNVFCKLHKEDGFQIHKDDLEACVTNKTRCIVVTNPSNPTGTVLNLESLKAIRDIAVKYDLMVISDQVFERNIYDNTEYISLATLEGMKERCFSVFGVSKDFGLSGERLGYVIGPAKMISMMQIASSNMVGLPPHCAQYAVMAAMNDPSYINEWNKRFDKRRKLGFEILNEIPYVSCMLPQGGFYLFPDIHELGTSKEIVTYLVKEANVAVGSGDWFGSQGEGHLRIMYGRLDDDTLYMEALNRIKEALTKLAYEKYQL